MILKDVKDWFGFGLGSFCFLFYKREKTDFNGCCSTAKHWIKD